ncbi:MCE family protein [Mycolicibacterium sp.]|uniref:MCE family protein n=1 Tax=Mycolicibacterium sp. TaxID=2320850 RepID=UPI00356034A0
MTVSRNARIGVGLALVLVLVAGIAVVLRPTSPLRANHYVAYFDNSNGIFPGDEVRILGVPVGKIDAIEPLPDRAKISFWVGSEHQIPAEVNAVIMSPQLVTARAIQLTPAYTGGPLLADNAVIPRERTAVPVEWDDFRDQLEKLTESLQPRQPDGVSPLGAVVNTAAENLRGQGAKIRDTIVKLSQAFSALGDHSADTFSTLKNLSILVSALQSSTDLMAQVNHSLASVTELLANDPREIDRAVGDINAAASRVHKFVADHREPLGASADKLASITTAVTESLDDLKQTLHVAPNAFQNFVNIFQPVTGAATGVLAATNFANPVSFLCGAIQAASRLGAEQSAKLCVQYLAPIIKNRQYNFPPLGMNPIVGPSARPNEITYSEDWLRPDYRPEPAAPAPNSEPAQAGLHAAEAHSEPTSSDPAAGLPGLMIPGGGGQ